MQTLGYAFNLHLAEIKGGVKADLGCYIHTQSTILSTEGMPPVCKAFLQMEPRCTGTTWVLGPGKNRTVSGVGVVLRCRMQTESVLLCFCHEVSRREAAPSGEPCWRVDGSDGQS